MLKIDLNILTADDCQACRKCCTFDLEELVDAPVFTDVQKRRVDDEFECERIGFRQKGALWQIVLRKLVGQDKYVCPLYDRAAGLCRVYDYEIFDCRTWPYYVMRKDGKVVITLSRDCPVVNAADLDTVRRFAKDVIGPKMLEAARKCPELVTPYHGNAIVVVEVDDPC